MRWLSILLAASCFAQIPTTTTLSFTPNPVNVSAPATATVAVTPAATGTVAIYDRSTEIARRVLDNSAATIPLKFTKPGTPFLRAIYTGSPTHSPSVSAELKVSVRAPSVTAFLAPVPQAHPPLTRDLNFDGIPDSYTVLQTTITIRFGVSGGGFGTPVISNLPASYEFLDFADFDSDARMDVLARDASGYVLEVLSGGVGGLITSQVLDRITSNGFPYSVTVGDTNADGFPDVSYRRNNAFGGVSYVARFSDGKGRFLPESALIGGHYLGDRNGDSLPDFARVHVSYIGRYLGPIVCFIDYSPDYLNPSDCGPSDASIVGVADLDGDGLLDLVSSNSAYSIYGTTPGLSLLRANPAGFYYPTISIPVTEGQAVIGLADLNGDGREDVVSRQSNAIIVRFGLSTGTLAAPAVLNAPGMTLSGSAAIADATGDGVPDVVIEDPHSQRLVFAGAIGAIPPASPPTSTSVTSGSGLTGTLTAKYQDTNGAVNLSLAYLLISPTLNGANACLVEVNTVSNRVRLMNDAGNGWSAYQLVHPTSADLANTQCPVIVGSMAVAISGDELTITVPVKFAASFAGQKKIYLNAMDASGLESTFVERGQWNVTTTTQPPPTGPPSGVSVKSLTPATGTGNTTRFRAVFQHSAGKHYLGYVLFLPTPNIVWYTAQGSCLIEYNRISNGVRLINDAGDGWLGPVSGVVIRPGAQTLENAQCAVDVASASSQVTGETMAVEANVTFKAGLAGVLGTFLQGFDTEGVFTGMTQFGNWVAPGMNSRVGPAIHAAQLNRSGAVYNLTASVRHTEGPANLSLIHLRIAPKILGDPVCHIVYSPFAKKINLVNDTELALVSSTWIDPGKGTLSNSYCTVFGPGGGISDAQFSQLSLTLRFNPATFSGPKYLYVNAFDNAGLLTHWVTANSTTIE